MLERLKGLFGRNKKEIQKIEESNHGKESLASKMDHKAILENANGMIKSLDEATCRYEKATLGSDSRQQKACRKEVECCENVIQKSTQGKLKDVISSYFGQIDKKIHNTIYNANSNFGNWLWNKHCINVNKRAKDLPGYITKNSFLVLLFSGAAALAGHYANVYGEFLSTISYLMIGASGLATVNMAVKASSTSFDNKKYGSPLLVQEKDIYHGTYSENIRNAKCALQTSRLLTGEAQLTEPNIDLRLSSGEEKLLEDEVAMTGEIEIMETQEELIEPDMQNYGNINIGFMEASPFYQTHEGKMPFAQAISAARRVDVKTSSDEEKEKKIAAYNKLYQSLGSGKPRKKKEQDSSKKLNDYNQTLKSLSEYGRKVHSGTATEKEYNTYMGLLYHLGKDDDFITDFLSDEYDRYMADKKEYEEKALAKRR